LRITNLILSLAVAGALALTYGAPAARADKTFTHSDSGLQFDLPDGWQSEADGEMLTVSSPDDTLSIVFWVTEADDFEAAAEALGEELGKQVKNLKLDGEPKEGQHNGMEYASVTGTGQVDGVNVAFSADLLMAKKPVIILTFASPENFAKHQGAYAKLVKSIRKVN
jgi:predicted Zn-dependent protease